MAENLFSAGNDGPVPQGDAARQAVDSLRGYAYQVTAAALAWLDLDDLGRLFLELAEDYAIVARNAIEAVQVKDTEASGAVTLNTDSVRDAVANFVSLREKNPKADVQLRYFTTSEIGQEKLIVERPNGMAGLIYWRKAATGADVKPIRLALESAKFSSAVREFVNGRSDEALRSDLLQKIHWDCGKPSLIDLRKEFEERLIVLGRDVFSLPAPEAMRIADTLIYRVLQKSIAKNPADRVLNRSNLYSSIDEATRIFVPRATVDALDLISTGLAASAFASFGASLPVATSEPTWLIDGDSLPLPKRMVSRAVIEAVVGERMRRYGTSVVFGASGLGKSSVARSVARNSTDHFAMIDFRNASADETRSRLDAIVSRIGGIRAPVIIFEDLNHFSDPLVAASIARVFEALRRRDRASVVTCYLSPTPKALSDAGLDAGCSIQCPYFTEEEATELVILHGGDAKLWGRLAYVSGAFGHPQLVHAFVAGMGARGWPRSELPEILGRGLSTGDIDAEREAARHALVSVIPENARNLLYRLSLAIGQFDRAMALAIAGVPPPIAQAGECIDILIGPWLEMVGGDRYRVSPLAAQSGQGAMSSEDQSDIHSAIATQYVASGTINGRDADAILLHAMLGKNDYVLFRMSQSILTANERTAGRLAESLTTFKLLRTDKPIYQNNLLVSVMLRLAQFKILGVAREGVGICDCVAALFSEADRITNPEMRDGLLSMIYASVLGTKGIANYLDNWLDLLLKFRVMTEGSGLLRRLQKNFEKKSPKLFGALFAIGSMDILTVERLENIIDQLDQVESSWRVELLSAFSESAPDYSVFINGAWSLEHQRGAVNALDAAERYRRMASKTASWDIRPITLQCWTAQAVMLDEYAENREGALAVLDKAVEILGNDVVLSRSRAKIYWRAQDHARALPILRAIADQIGLNNNIERAFALREAAISAAKSGEWAQAETWLLESKDAAAKSGLPNMKAMAIGLGADAAVAALQIGEIERALRCFAETLSSLAGIDPASSLHAYYCHAVVRHTVLWAQAHLEKRDVKIDGAPIAIEPGCCSNPDPPKAIADRPLGPLDLAWYMLAESEAAVGVDASIAQNLDRRLVRGRIPVMEIGLRERRVRRDIATLDGSGFVVHLASYVEAMVYLSQHGEQMKTTFDVFDPTRGDIPQLSHPDILSPAAVGIANDAVFAFAIIAALDRSGAAPLRLQEELKVKFGSEVPVGSHLVRLTAMARVPKPSTFEEALIDSVGWFVKSDHSSPEAYCFGGIRFFQQAGRSHFRRYLVSRIAAWEREAWTRIVVSETFRLSRPRHTVPDIKAALAISSDDERFLCTLFLAAASAVGATLPPEVKAEFESVAAT